jgi:ElaB/YqjD/DUF883 family membrane-anchored ribosome-binding protein
MTNPSDPTNRPPLDADDPRISEWIDGRLAAAEAAEVEQAVRESPALTRLVADLQAVKEAARLVPVVSPPEGFVDRVLHAVVSGGGAAAHATDAESDRVVEQEWRAVEAERLAEERAEAEADVAQAVSPVRQPVGGADSRGAWPWLSVGAALAAGLLVTVLLNRPDDTPREIAQVTAQPERERFAADRSVATSAAGEVSPPGAPAAARPPAWDEAAVMEKALQPLQDQPPALAAREAAPAARELQANGMLRQSASEDAKARPADLDGLAAPKPAAAAGLGAPQDRPAVVTVESWTEFDRLLEAHGIEAKPLADREEGISADPSGDWTLELTGPPAAIGAFLAAAGEGRLARRRAVAGEEADAGQPADARQPADAGERADKAEEAAANRGAVAKSAAQKRDEEAVGGARGAAGRVLIRLVIDQPPEPNPKPEPEASRE